MMLWVWAALTAATGLSWWLDDGAGDAAAVAVLAIAFVKVWLVGEHFMELRRAPTALRRAFTGYTILVPVGLVVIYLTG